MGGGRGGGGLGGSRSSLAIIRTVLCPGCPRLGGRNTSSYKILVNFSRWCMTFKGIVSRDFEWLHMILMDRLCVPDVPLEV